MKSGVLRKGIFLISIIAALYQAIYSENAVTFELGDRFGDNLASFAHAKWISYTYGIPLRITPFKYSNYLKLSVMHKQRDPNELFKNTVHIRKVWERVATKNSKMDLSTFRFNKNEDTLYVVHYFAETKSDVLKGYWPYFDIDWDDQEFVNQLREEISPIIPLPRIELPKDRISIALHLRKGSGPDFTHYNIQDFPLRFPPDSFFIEQIKRFLILFKGKTLYVHLFTDYNNPIELLDEYKKALNDKNIRFGYSLRSYDLAVLEDFFNLTCFDCIIRPESHFSQMASRLSKAKIVVHPKAFKWGKDVEKSDERFSENCRVKRTWTITDVEVIRKK